jgi:hypothetical protein
MDGSVGEIGSLSFRNRLCTVIANFLSWNATQTWVFCTYGAIFCTSRPLMQWMTRASHALNKRCGKNFILPGCYAASIGHPESETERLSRNVSNYKATLRNIPEERSSHWHRGGDPKSHKRKVDFILWCGIRNWWLAGRKWLVWSFRQSA